MSDGDESADPKALRRMIAYIRGEALRLRIMDVAFLLEHAEDAVAASGTEPPADRRMIEIVHPAPDVIQ